MLIIQISDSHISTDHPSRTADLARTVGQINALATQPELIVHTGDVTHHGTADEFGIARGALDELKAPYLVIPGNKDERQPMREAFADLADFNPNDRFIQYGVEHYPIRLICLDTRSDTSNKGRICPARLADLRLMLEQEPDRTTAIFMHHPPFEIQTVPEPFQYEERADVQAFSDLIARHKQICGLFCGHIHRPGESVVAGVRGFAMSAGAVDLRKGEANPLPPEFPLYSVHELEPRRVEADHRRTPAPA